MQYWRLLLQILLARLPYISFDLGACRGINPKALNSFTFNILFLLYIL
jgi:hypothetical protein